MRPGNTFARHSYIAKAQSIRDRSLAPLRSDLERKHADGLRSAGVYFREWTGARFAWVLANPRRLPVPVHYCGLVGPFDVEEQIPGP